VHPCDDENACQEADRRDDKGAHKIIVSQSEVMIKFGYNHSKMEDIWAKENPPGSFRV
jgi:hypothetical protein